MNVMGTKKTITKKKLHKIIKWFSFSRRKRGKPMPTFVVWGPSGFPYFSQFRFAMSSVKAW